MRLGDKIQLASGAVSLQNAVLCIDCESVTNNRNDECPVCGGHSLLTLAGLLGGTLVDQKEKRARSQKIILFDLRIGIELSQIEGRDLNAIIEGITNIIGPKLGRDRASLHVAVEPSEGTTAHGLQAA